MTSTNNMFYRKSEMFRIIQVFNGSWCYYVCMF